MRKTNKNLTKQILTLTLAFVLVFTGMGIGSWGVDEAWADGLWDVEDELFEVYVNGTKYDVMDVDDVDVSGPAVLVPEGTVQIQIKQIQGYPAVLYNNDLFGLYDTREDVKIDSEYTKNLKHEEDSSYSNGIFNIPLKMFDKSPSKVYPLKIMLMHIEGYERYLNVGFISSSNSIPTLGKNINSETTLYLKSGSTFTVPLDGIFQDADGDALAYKVKVGNDGSYTTLTGKTYSGTYDGTETVLYFKANDGTADSEDVYTVYLKNNKLTSQDLSEVIENAPKAKSDETYYHTNDRFNGRFTSVNGFWNDMQAALTEAKALFTNNDVQQGLKADVTEEQIAAAYAKLNGSIDALIPKTQANTTKLYEAIKESEKFDTSLSYNSDNLAFFTEKQSAAKTLLSLLFEKGKATEANKPKKQDDIDETASELKDSYSDDKMTVEISTQETLTNFLTKAGSGIKGKLLTDITLSGYETVYSFSGELDGNGHAIIVDNAYPGLVDTNNGTIRNLTVDGADLVSISAICKINKGLIENCRNAANFSNDANNNNKQKGAICNTNDTTGIIRSCYNTGKLSGTYVGGICGTNLGLVENCFNTGLIDAESNAGGIVWRNHNNSESSGIGGTIRNCYNFNVMHHTAGWGSIYGSYIYNNLGPICGDNERSSVSTSATSSKTIYVEGTVENGLYLDTVISNKPNGRPLSIALSDIYLAQKKAYDNLGAGTSAGTAIAGWTEKDSASSIFADDTDYYVFYDNTNGHFIAVTFDDAAASAVIDAAKPSAQSELCKSAAGAEKKFYLVKVPTGTKAVTFKNTEMIIDYANGYTNRYVKAYQQLDSFGVNFGPELSRKFVGTAIGSSDVSTILSKVSAICGSDTATVAFVKEMLSGVETQSSIVTPSEKEIKVSFRLVGATKSPSGNYDAKTNKDPQYVTWIATRTYSLKDGSSVGDLLKLAIKESGIKTVGEENNYVSGVYAPNVLGNYYLAEFTNGTRSGWMYTVNGKHPGVGLNGYYLKDGDRVIWHYINDYSYEVSDWFDDPVYPNLGNASTWDPWLKVPDVDPTKDTPTLGGAQTEEVKDVTTDTKTGTTTAPTDVKVSEKTNADGTKTKVADVKVSADNQKEILKQAKEKKSNEIILVVSSKSVGDATKADVTLDKSFIDSIVKDTNAKLTIKTPFGDKTYTQDELKAMSEAATGSTVTVVIEKAAEPTDDAAAKIAKAKSIIKDMKLVARSSKTAKKNIKAVLKSDAKVKASIKEMKDLGFTVKYRFYRSTKKAASYKAAVTKKTAAYTNTSGKKGTKYFYKVQVRVYDENGKLVAKTALKQCKYASRTWTKAK